MTPFALISIVGLFALSQGFNRRPSLYNNCQKIVRSVDLRSVGNARIVAVPARRQLSRYENGEESEEGDFPTTDFGDFPVGGDDVPETDVPADAAVYEQLRTRQSQLSRGIGRRYVTRTQKGFLNVHTDPHRGPYVTDNVVGRLREGQVVTGIGAITEDGWDWIEHDGGGWSISEFGGFVWLEPLRE